MTSYPSAGSATLSDSHCRMLFEESGISPDVAAERGYYTAHRCSEVPQDRGELPKRPGLVVPMYSPDGITRSYQLRPDRKGKGPKYVSPGGVSPVVDVHPSMLDEVRTGIGPLLITEGAKTGDAATSRGIATVVLAGVWMWCVPKVKPYRLKPCFDYIRLEGREVVVAFDSDCMSKENVQDALAALVAALEERGAVVKVIYLPDATDGSKQGIDDYLVAGGTIKEMFMLARTFEPADIGEIRMSQSDKLREAISCLWREWRDGDWMDFVGAAKPNVDGEIKGHWARGHTARDTMEALIELAMKSGKVHDVDGGVELEVAVGMRRLSELSAKSRVSTSKAIRHLEADKQIRTLPPADKSKARRYRLFVPRARVYQYEGKAHDKGSERSVPPRWYTLARPPSSPPSAPRLRWPSPGRKGRREFEVVPGTRRVRHTGALPPEDREDTYIKRLGPHRGAVLDTLEAAGGELHLDNLCEALHRKRPRDVRGRILKPLEDAGILECEGDVVRLAGEWLDRLEEERERTGEVKQAEKQAEKHREQRKRYREHLERERCGTPKASLAAMRRTKELRERGLREIREEEERDRAPTPPAVEALVANALGQQDRVRMGQLYDMAIDEGLRWRDVPPAVRRMGFRVERLPEYLNNEFVFPAKPPLLTVEPLVENPLPLTEPLTEPLIEEPPAADYGDHSPFCDCEHCGHSEPKYARAYAGSGSPMAGVA